jgi:hypothetical protein
VVNENFWNENKRLSPKYTKYHINNHTFRKTPVNLEAVKRSQQDELFESEMRSVAENRKASKERI